MNFATLGRTLSFALAGLCIAGASSAAPVETYGDIASPGVYFGSGNVNGNWTVSTDGNVEVALRAKNRATLATIDGSSGVYSTAGGLCNPVCSGGSKAMWNYEFSVNLQAGGGSLTFSDVFVRLGVDTDGGAGVTYSFLDVLNNWPDNAYWDGSAPRRNGTSPVTGEYGVQQSANPLFGDSGYGFLPGPGLYDLQLSVYANDNGQFGSLLGQVDIQVQVVPEPSSMALVGLGLLGAAVIARRRRTR